VFSETADDIKLSGFHCAVKSESRDITGISGTPPIYRAPEALSTDIRYGREVDMWSIGAITYILFMGNLPFSDSDIHRRNFVISSDKLQHISNDAKAFILALLDVNVETRYFNMYYYYYYYYYYCCYYYYYYCYYYYYYYY